MGSSHSQAEIEEYASVIYENALGETCLLPDIGIDKSLEKYSGLDSNSVLQTYSNDLVNNVPGFAASLGSSLAALNSVPNAVGLGALVISMIMEIGIKIASYRGYESFSMLRRVFGEEKASSVRDTMSHSLKQHHILLKEEQKLLTELGTLQQQLSSQLTILQNSLLLDGQMSTRGLKIWVNGAFFHVQMLIHEARLSRAQQTDQQASDTAHSVSAAIDYYSKHLDDLLEKYKSYKISITKTGLGPAINDYSAVCAIAPGTVYCGVHDTYLKNTELNCIHFGNAVSGYETSRLIEAFVNIFLSNEPVSGIKKQFSNTKTNLNSLISQHNVFFLPSRA